MIYFDKDKQAYGSEIPEYIATIDEKNWQPYAGTDKWDIVDGEFLDITNTEEYKAKQKAKEKKHIQTLYMTRSDFFDGMIKAFNVGSNELLTIIQNILETQPINNIEKKVAINNYKNALNFYRKHPLFSMLSNIDINFNEKIVAQFTEEQWDKFFVETNKKNPEAYKELLPNN